MQRIPATDEATASGKAAGLLGAVRKQMGGVPNILATMATAPAVLDGYLGLAGALGKGRLTPRLREQIALAVAGANRCDYCASVHTALGGQHGVPEDELRRNLDGEASEPRVAAALRLATRIVEARGNLADADLDAARQAGFDDEEIVEVVANTVLNIFTNYFNHIAATEIDFPVVRTGLAAAA